MAHALARYPARAGVLVAPVLGGWGTFGAALRRNPVGTLPAVFGGRLRLSRRQLFSRELPAATAADYTARLGRATARAQWQLLLHRDPEPPVGDPPVLVAGQPGRPGGVRRRAAPGRPAGTAPRRCSSPAWATT